MQPSQAIHPKLFVALTHAVGLGTVALTIGAFQLLAYQPLRAQQEANVARSAQLKQMLQDAIVVRREHVQLTQQMDKLTQRVERSRKLAPSRSPESTFLADASRIAEETGLEINDYRRGRVRHLPTHSELEITLCGSGAHEGICQFLGQIESLPRAKRVTRLEIESHDSPTAYPLEVAYTLYFGLKDPSKTP